MKATCHSGRPHRILGHYNQCCIHRPQSNHQSDLEPNIALLFSPFLLQLDLVKKSNHNQYTGTHIVCFLWNINQEILTTSLNKIHVSVSLLFNSSIWDISVNLFEQRQIKNIPSTHSKSEFSCCFQNLKRRNCLLRYLSL